MEDLCRSRRIDNLNVVFGRQLQKTFEPRARMLGACTFESVRQQHHQAAQPVPFVFGTDNELVDDHLSDIGEIAELSFPTDQSVGGIQTVSVFVTEHSRFAQTTVVDFDRSLIRGEMSERHVRSIIFDIVKNGVTMTESSTFRVLTVHSNAMSFETQRCKGQRFASRPIEGLFPLRDRQPLLQDAGRTLVDNAGWG